MNKRIVFAGGCFWGVEKYFALIQGVVSTRVGYANGNTENPTYEDVCYNDTGHAEAVEIEYDPTVVHLDFLLTMFYRVIDPTALNRQGNDVGKQYRSGVYYQDAEDKAIIDVSIAELKTQYDKPIAIEVQPLQNFYPAEEYHQKYLDKNPAGYCHIGAQKFADAKNARPEA